jgi:hypothetical protein
VRFASDPERVRTMGLNARAQVLRGFGVEQAAAGTLRAIRSVVTA